VRVFGLTGTTLSSGADEHHGPAGENAFWGPHVFLEGSGTAEEIRGDYARESAGWPPLHFAIAEAKPEALDPWYRLGFAQMHAYATRESGGERSAVRGVTIRRGGPEEIETALRIDRLIHEAQAAAPSYSSVAFDEGPHRADWEETLAAEDTAYFLAEDETGAVGHATVYPDPVDTQALHLASTAVDPAARGRGIGVALTTHALAYAADEGYPRMRTNWRVTNLGASRFWPSRGFQLTHLRLVRRLPDL
jgi:ribosomal protein S18 acetylase RimI-like enzyme